MFVEKNIKIINKLGLHARAAAKLVQLSAGFESTIKLQNDRKNVDAKSIMGVLMLAAAQGSELTLSAEGTDAQQASEDIAALFNDCFGEGE